MVDDIQIDLGWALEMGASVDLSTSVGETFPKTAMTNYCH